MYGETAQRIFVVGNGNVCIFRRGHLSPIVTHRLDGITHISVGGKETRKERGKGVGTLLDAYGRSGNGSSSPSASSGRSAAADARRRRSDLGRRGSPVLRLPPPPPARSIAGSSRYMACGSSDDNGGQQRATGVGCARQRILPAVPATTPAPVLPSSAQSLTLPATPCDLATRSLLRGITATWAV
ncbi:hypothetical protein ALC62_06156 [Cyphomyrmex costatus]|uniref:Uncharacterized protein n=1 Tax=Cyphomyrmex costatus TaxID=456900 RepID=A0A195CQT1_9HYME|nr:hypothetical protein ALC62_06156 [Cyphomyrmex costatus]